MTPSSPLSVRLNASRTSGQARAVKRRNDLKDHVGASTNTPKRLRREEADGDEDCRFPVSPGLHLGYVDNIWARAVVTSRQMRTYAQVEHPSLANTRK